MPKKTGAICPVALGCGLLYLCCDLFSWPLPSSLPKMSDSRPPPLVAPRPLRRAEEVGGRRQRLRATSTATEVEQRAVEANCLCLYRHFWDRAEQQQGQEEEECIMYIILKLRLASVG